MIIKSYDDFSFRLNGLNFSLFYSRTFFITITIIRLTILLNLITFTILFFIWCCLTFWEANLSFYLRNLFNLSNKPIWLMNFFLHQSVERLRPDYQWNGKFINHCILIHIFNKLSYSLLLSFLLTLWNYCHRCKL